MRALSSHHNGIKHLVQSVKFGLNKNQFEGRYSAVLRIGVLQFRVPVQSVNSLSTPKQWGIHPWRQRVANCMLEADPTNVLRSIGVRLRCGRGASSSWMLAAVASGGECRSQRDGGGGMVESDTATDYEMASVPKSALPRCQNGDGTSKSDPAVLSASDEATSRPDSSDQAKPESLNGRSDAMPAKVATSAAAETARRTATLSRRAKSTVILWDAISFVIATVLSLVVLDADSQTWRTNGVVLSLLCSAVMFAVFAQQRLYNSRHVSRRSEELRRMVNASALGAVCVAALPMIIDFDPHPQSLLALFVLVLLLSGIGREVMRRIIRSQRIAGNLSRRVILVGDNREAEELHEMLEGTSELGYHVVGRVTVPNGAERSTSGWGDHSDGCLEREGALTTPWLGTTDQILEVVRDNGANGVVVATTDIDLQTANRLVRALTNEGIYVEMSSAMRDIAARRIWVRPLGRYPVMSVEPLEAGGWKAVFKRCFDIVVSSLILLTLVPVLIPALLAIRITSGPGVIFRQTRVGRKGELFTVYKLRTMVRDAESLLPELLGQNEAAGPMFKMADDPRVTKIGGWLRKTSIDEVPQFVNVIKGDMSLVGPRPALPCEAAQWSDDLRERLRVKPGITGNWQINGRFTSSLEDYQRLDMFYVDNWSIVTDLVIMAKTIPAVLKRNGAA